MTYDPNIPQGNDNISTSQNDILTNFEQLNTLFNRDHYTWNDPTSAFRGGHRKMSFPAALAADPALGSFVAHLFPKNDANDTSLRPQMFFKNATETLQVTNRFYNDATEGYIILPFGTPTHPSLILMWGNVPSTTTFQPPVPFHTISNFVYPNLPFQGFPNNCFNVQLTLANNSAGSPNPTVRFCLNTADAIPAFDRLNFRLRINVDSLQAAASIYWFAIGN